MKEAVIVSAVRTAVGKAPKGMYRTTHPEVLAVAAMRGALDRAPGLDPAEIDDVMMGCAFPEAEQGLNVGRNYALLAGLPESVPGFTMNRFCSSGLQAIALGAQAIMSGMADVVLAGGRGIHVSGTRRRQQGDVQWRHAGRKPGRLPRHGADR